MINIHSIWEENSQTRPRQSLFHTQIPTSLRRGTERATSLHFTGPGSTVGLPVISVQVYVATFAVSAYASSYHRAGSKPFNPVLGETYECCRADKGFRFIAEQVETGTPAGTRSRMHSSFGLFYFFLDPHLIFSSLLERTDLHNVHRQM